MTWGANSRSKLLVNIEKGEQSEKGLAGGQTEPTCRGSGTDLVGKGTARGDPPVQDPPS